MRQDEAAENEESDDASPDDGGDASVAMPDDGHVVVAVEDSLDMPVEAAAPPVMAEENRMAARRTADRLQRLREIREEIEAIERSSPAAEQLYIKLAYA